MPSAPAMPATSYGKEGSRSMHLRVEEELGSLVRAVVGSSRLRTEPTRLELQLVCQELVSQVKSYFSKLESSAAAPGPMHTSFATGGGVSTSAETLSVRLAALGAKTSFSSPLHRPSQEAPADRLRRWASPPNNRAPSSFSREGGDQQRPGTSEHWKYTDWPFARSPPPSTYERTYSALENFQRKWAEMGTGSDGRPLSPAARLRQEKLRLAQRSADLIDEKLQAYGISPVRASRLYNPGHTSLKSTMPTFHAGSPQTGRQLHTTSTFMGRAPCPTPHPHPIYPCLPALRAHLCMENLCLLQSR